MEKVNIDTWEITQITISRETWVSGRPFNGSIRFRNTQDEEISFNIPTDKLPGIISMIAESSMETAKRIGIEISKSLPQVLMQTALSPSLPEDKKELVSDEREPNDLCF